MKTSWLGTAALTTAAATLVFTGFASAQGMGRMGADDQRPAFETLDADGDGNVTVAEMKAHMEAEFGERDTNGDGVLSAEELTAAITARAAERAAIAVGRMIEWRDTDGDGALSPAEMGENNGQRMFERADANDDGMISAEEFAAVQEKGGRGDRFGRHGGDHDGQRGGKGGSHGPRHGG